MRRVAIVTTARSDYGIYRPILRALQARDDVTLRIIAGGMHLSPEFGLSVREIESDGFAVDDRVELLLSSDTPLGTAKSVGLAVLGFAESFSRLHPDIVVVLGDRFEMHAAALAALPLQLPLAHVHGGEVTDGAMDDALRHGISKMAHLHYVSTERYRERLERLGEEPWRILVTGAPSLDNLHSMTLLDEERLYAALGLPSLERPIMVTYHPVTRHANRCEQQIDALFRALESRVEPLIFTLPNADPAGRRIAELIRSFAADGERRFVVDNIGTQRYFSLMHKAAAMVGNSSSGILEAASFELPVVNIGSRQDGRVRNANVIDVPHDEHASAIAAAIERALSPAFRSSLHGRSNVYGRGEACSAIAASLATTPIDDRLLHKTFYDG